MCIRDRGCPGSGKARGIDGCSEDLLSVPHILEVGDVWRVRQTGPIDRHERVPELHKRGRGVQRELHLGRWENKQQVYFPIDPGAVLVVLLVLAYEVLARVHADQSALFVEPSKRRPLPECAERIKGLLNIHQCHVLFRIQGNLAVPDLNASLDRACYLVRVERPVGTHGANLDQRFESLEVFKDPDIRSHPRLLAASLYIYAQSVKTTIQTVLVLYRVPYVTEIAFSVPELTRYPNRADGCRSRVLEKLTCLPVI